MKKYLLIAILMSMSFYCFSLEKNESKSEPQTLDEYRTYLKEWVQSNEPSANNVTTKFNGVDLLTNPQIQTDFPNRFSGYRFPVGFGHFLDADQSKRILEQAYLVLTDVDKERFLTFRDKEMFFSSMVINPYIIFDRGSSYTTNYNEPGAYLFLDMPHLHNESGDLFKKTPFLLDEDLFMFPWNFYALFHIDFEGQINLVDYRANN